MSSSLSGIGTSKMMPLNEFEGLAVTGREQLMERPATSVRLRSFSCCSSEEGKAERSPPRITSESRTSPIRALRARWKESRSPRDKALNLILLSVKLIITGAIWGEGARGSISST